MLLTRLRVAVVVALGGAIVVAAGAGLKLEPTDASTVRTYYIAAEEVPWDYAPQQRNMVTGTPFGPTARVFVQRGRDRIGHVYLKSLFRGYTDATFRHRAPLPPQWQHLGFLGPPIEAEVGDTIRVVFRNNTHLPASMHPHGVMYAKDSEGSLYNDGTSAGEPSGRAMPLRVTMSGPMSPL